MVPAEVERLIREWAIGSLLHVVRYRDKPRDYWCEVTHLSWGREGLLAHVRLLVPDGSRPEFRRLFVAQATREAADA